jgi:hypothetical protein
VFRRGLVARDPAEIAATLGLDGDLISGEMSRETAVKVAEAIRRETGAPHALAVLIEVDDGPTASISAAASISQSPRERGPSLGARASMAAATGCGSVPLNSASTACAATCKDRRSPNAPISSGYKQAPSAAAAPGSSKRRVVPYHAKKST